MKKVSVVLSNRFAKLIHPYPLEKLTPYFSFRPSGYHFMPAYRNGYWDGYVRLLKRNRVPTGLFLVHREQIETDLGIRFEVKRKFMDVPFRTLGVDSDRDYQNECVEKMIDAAKHSGGGLVLAATASGKTRIAGMFYRLLKGCGCFIVDELTLLNQARDGIAHILDEEVGIVGDSIFKPKRITVATVQTLHLHSEDPEFEPWTNTLQVNIIDEVHLALNKRNFAVVEAIAPPAVFGLTATLELKKKDVATKAYALAGPVCYEYSLTTGVEEGYLAKGVVVQVERQGLSDEPYGPSQHALMYRDLVVTDPDRNRVITDLVRVAIEKYKHTIVLVERLKHLKILSKLLQDIPHRVVAGSKEISEGIKEKISVEHRMESKKRFEKGEVRLILANKVFSKGIDIARVDVIVDAAGMKNKNRAVQVHGRGIRLCENKLGLLHFDVADTGNRYERAARWRRSALKKKGIPLKKVEWKENACEVFSVAEKMLLKYLKKPKNEEKEVQEKRQLLLFEDVPHCLQ